MGPWGVGVGGVLQEGWRKFFRHPLPERTLRLSGRGILLFQHALKAPGTGVLVFGFTRRSFTSREPASFPTSLSLQQGSREWVQALRDCCRSRRRVVWQTAGVDSAGHRPRDVMFASGKCRLKSAQTVEKAVGLPAWELQDGLTDGGATTRQQLDVVSLNERQ